MTNPLVSIITVTHNRKEKLANLLTSIYAQTYKPIEVILIENSSSDGTRVFVEREFPMVRILSMPKNLGSVAYNYGVRTSHGEFILLIDDDGLPVDDQWVKRIVSCFQSNLRLGVVCCKIRMKDTGEIAHDNPEFIQLGVPSLGYPASSYNGTGAGIRASAIREMDFYPEFFFLSWIELHLCTRLLDKGWEVRYFPAIEVWHDRPSGSVKRTFTYEGIISYYLYVWSLSPDLFLAAMETIRYAGYLTKCAIRGEVSALLVVRSLANALMNINSALKTRTPVSRSTWDYLWYVRMGKLDKYIDKFLVRQQIV